MYKKTLSLVTVAMMGGIMVLASGQSAEAKTCTYMGVVQGEHSAHGGSRNFIGKTRIETTGKGAVKKFACNRARTKCEKKAKALAKSFGHNVWACKQK